MPKECSEEGCDREVFAKGLCSMHYQRHRREQGQNPGQVGRPREYSDKRRDKHGGAPRFSVRLEPQIHDWVRSKGGGAWLRHVAGELHALENEKDFAPWWGRFEIEDGD